jgi:surfeit locus 1 family protein
VPLPRIRLGARVLAPTRGPTLVVLPIVALLIIAGSIELRRAGEREQLWEAFAKGDDAPLEMPRAARPPPRYAHVEMKGRYLAAYPFLLDNMSHQGVPGYRVLTPFERENGETVLVDRGFIPRGRQPPGLNDLLADSGERSIRGRADLLPRAGIELKSPEPPAHWPKIYSYPKMEDLERALKRPLHPDIVLLDPAEKEGYLRDWQPPGLPPERLSAYALTWFALALTVFALYIRYSLEPGDA